MLGSYPAPSTHAIPFQGLGFLDEQAALELDSWLDGWARLTLYGPVGPERRSRIGVARSRVVK